MPEIGPNQAERGDEHGKPYRRPERTEGGAAIASFGFPPAEPAPNIDSAHAGKDIDAGNAKRRSHGAALRNIESQSVLHQKTTCTRSFTGSPAKAVSPRYRTSGDSPSPNHRLT